MKNSFEVAIIPLAGLGTRWLPFTKAVPKEFLPIGTKPAVHYVVQEAIEAGVKKIVFVVSPGRFEVRKYFERDPNLELFLMKGGRATLLKALRSADFKVSFDYVVQKKPLGLGNAIALCGKIVKKRSFFVLLPDEVFFNQRTSSLAKLADVATETRKCVVGVQKVERKEVFRYGVLEILGAVHRGMVDFHKIIEKPKISEAPSEIAIVGRYAFTAEYWKAPTNDIDLTCSLNFLASKRNALAFIYKGTRYDLGKFHDFLEANLRMGKKNAS